MKFMFHHLLNTGDRPCQEDAVLAHPESGFFALADGFGGKNAGDVAAKAALEAMKHFIEASRGDSDATLPFIYRRYFTPTQNLIYNATLFANEKLCQQNVGKSLQARGGASALALLLDGHYAAVSHIGNVAGFLVRNNVVMPLVQPRSYQEFRKSSLQAVGQSSWLFPLSSLGLDVTLEPEVSEFRVQAGDLLCLATDGFYAGCSMDKIAECFSGVGLLGQGLASEVELSQLNQRLTESAQGAGMMDNFALLTILIG